MSRSFAQVPRALNACLVALALAGCATLPPPTAELSTAQQALNRAQNADVVVETPRIAALAPASATPLAGAASTMQDSDPSEA